MNNPFESWRPGKGKGLARHHSAGQWLTWPKVKRSCFPVLDPCHSARLLLWVSAEHCYSLRGCCRGVRSGGLLGFCGESVLDLDLEGWQAWLGQRTWTGHLERMGTQQWWRLVVNWLFGVRAPWFVRFADFCKCSCHKRPCLSYW